MMNFVAGVVVGAVFGIGLGFLGLMILFSLMGGGERAGDE